MKKTIRGTVYDTENAAVVSKNVHGYFGDPAGYEETLYETEDGKYFVYTTGGETPPYPAEKISCIAKAKVEAWLAAHNVNG